MLETADFANLIKIKPCPFCGADARLMVKKNKRFPYYVRCTFCGGRTERWSEPQKARYAWNRRGKNA